MTDSTQLDVLAIGAHPDDVELACGGTLIKLQSMGYRVGVMAGYGAFLFAVPLTAILLALGVYWSLEWLLRPLDSRKGEGRLPGEPPPARAEVHDAP